MQYRKHYIPLESNPDLFTQIARQLGLSDAVAFHDVLSLEDDALLALVPRPALALVLVFPTSTDYEASVAGEDAREDVAEYAGSGELEPVVWYKQTINNACGLYGILHAVSNGSARESIGKWEKECDIFPKL
jgi:ubiquitin carboxyl-terminal hydrolase L3